MRNPHVQQQLVNQRRRWTRRCSTWMRHRPDAGSKAGCSGSTAAPAAPPATGGSASDAADRGSGAPAGQRTLRRSHTVRHMSHGVQSGTQGQLEKRSLLLGVRALPHTTFGAVLHASGPGSCTDEASTPLGMPALQFALQAHSL